MAVEWTNIYRRFKGLWVALGDDEKTVIASGKTPKQTLQRARKKGHEMPILARMPSQLGSFVGASL